MENLYGAQEDPGALQGIPVARIQIHDQGTIDLLVPLVVHAGQRRNSADEAGEEETNDERVPEKGDPTDTGAAPG